MAVEEFLRSAARVGCRLTGKAGSRPHKEVPVNERLRKMHELGQSPWVDEISRDDIKNGGLERLIEDGILGATSNPSSRRP